MKKIAIFGSTGSIGESTLNVVRENPETFQVVTLVAGKNINKLILRRKHGYIFQLIKKMLKK